MKYVFSLITALALFLAHTVLYAQPLIGSATVLNKDTLVTQSRDTLSAPIDEITVAEYIESYWNIAVLEMKRTGIPASISLAQGIIESRHGNSRLARKANNHFGVKCRSDWRGGKAYKDDEEKNECFRRYQTPIQSFVDHSTFLAANQRYAFLFLLDLLDYRGWANGLEELGYSTSGHYAEKLTAIIETHRLFAYDVTGSKLDTLHLNQVTPGNYYKKYVQKAYTKKAHNLEEAKFAGKIAMDKLHEFHQFDEENGYQYMPKDANKQMLMTQMAENFHSDTNMVEQHKQSTTDPILVSDKQLTAKNLLTTIPNNHIEPITAANNKPNIQTITIKYTTQQGDSLYSLAQRFGISIETIKQHNQLSDDLLPIGKQLIIAIK